MRAEPLFEDLKLYSEFSSSDENRLRQVAPRVQPHLPQIVEGFYQKLLNHPGTRGSFPGGLAQAERLKTSLGAWIERLFWGPWDDSYYKLRLKTSQRHVEMGLPQNCTCAGIEFIREQILEILLKSSPPEALREELRSVNKLLCLDLNIMMQAHHEEYLEKTKRNERAATFGQLAVSIAHELRNPLTIIETSLFLLRRRVNPDPPVVSHLNKIEAQVSFSSRIINNMLEMVRERPVVAHAIEPQWLTQAALEAINKDDRARLNIELAPKLSKVRVDEDQAKQILLNLLMNALEASGPNGVVRLTAYPEDGHVSFLINDDGPGIDPSIKDKLFEPLVSTKKNGIGLGLALSRRLAERNGGSLHLSQGPLPGAAFVLMLPAS